MKLRKLDRDDALSMLEWMHDPSVVENLQADFASMRIEDCERFIESAQTAVHDLHLAIADDKDEYQGTVSLKHISGETAEFAIAIRKSTMGKGFSEYGMKEMLRIAFERLGLTAVYWCVSPENRRACRFYNKQGYRRFDVMKDSELYRDLVRGGTGQNTLPDIIGIGWTRRWQKGKTVPTEYSENLSFCGNAT